MRNIGNLILWVMWLCVRGVLWWWYGDAMMECGCCCVCVYVCMCVLRV